MAQQAGWRIDVNQCISCRACETACKAEYQLQAGQGRRRRVIERTRIESGVVRTFFVSVSCHHCEHPACKAACPRSKKLNDDGTVKTTDSPYISALYKDVADDDADLYTDASTKGVVLHNPVCCVGCRRCEWACPYGAPQFNPQTRKMHKCELCWQRVTSTNLSPERRTTACDATCLGGAITFIAGDAADSIDPVFSPAGVVSDVTEENSGDSTGGHFWDADEAGIDPSDVTGYTNSQWARPGELPGDAAYSEGRGSSESENYELTYPATRFRTRVYRTRAGGVE